MVLQRSALPIAGLSLALVASGCATAGSAPSESPARVVSVDEIDEQPVLHTCANLPGLYVRATVRVAYILGPDGFAVPTSIRPANPHLPADEIVQEAMRIAATCAWEPALVDGEPVATRVTHTIRLSPLPRSAFR